jgi:SAM-dependent methyltransferase
MDPMPLAGQLCRTREEAQSATRYPLTWVECAPCGLVQVLEDVDDRILFSAYNYASSSVPGLVRHFDEYATFLAARYGREPLRLLEIGCNDGVLLERLPPEWQLLGVDPSDVAGAAAARGYELLHAPFSSQLAADLPGAGRFDVVTGSNCLAHISDLLDVFRGVRALLRTGGEFILEIHDLGATADTGQWDTIYHEHKVEWSEQSLGACLAPLGFEPAFLQRLPLHGGLLRAGFRKLSAAAAPPAAARGRSYEALERAYRGRRDTPAYRELAHALRSGQRVSGYGASGRANVWLNQLPELQLSYIVDDSPLRNGKLLPCVATPVVAGQHFSREPTELCVITAWNFAADIRARYPGYTGRWRQSFGSAAPA